MQNNVRFCPNLLESYSLFKEPSLTVRRIKHRQILPLIDELKKDSAFSIREAGYSFEGRSIFLIRWGEGPKKVFFWSQMHGNEPTATRALFDLFRLLQTQAEPFSSWVDSLRQQVTLYAIPMLNPDGAERYQRRNMQNIDINRDAQKRVSPEAALLYQTFEEITPDFAFNLHDHSIYYSPGSNGVPAAFSFLAPVFNKKKDLNENRMTAMQLLSQLIKTISPYAPNRIGRYSDEYEPRAFGDTFQKMGAATILIESGGWSGDEEKDSIRALNFLLFATALNSIAYSEYTGFSTETYEQLPEITEEGYDLLIRHALYIDKNGAETLDIGFRREEHESDDFNSFYYRSSFEKKDSLPPPAFGYEEHDLTGYTIEPGVVLETPVPLDSLFTIVPEELYKQGITGVTAEGYTGTTPFTALPFTVFESKAVYRRVMKSKNNAPADFIIRRNGNVEYVIINGFFQSISTKQGKIKNGLLVR